jgi:hypothetical protein
VEGGGGEVVAVEEGHEAAHMRLYTQCEPCGKPLTRADGSLRQYGACKPSAAASKAFYAMVRRGELEGMRAQVPTVTDANQAALSENLDKLCENGKITRDEAVSYVARWRVLHTTALPSMLIFLTDPHHRSPRAYNVQYHPVLAPNMHEVKKGIIRTVRATYIPKRDVPTFLAAVREGAGAGESKA